MLIWGVFYSMDKITTLAIIVCGCIIAILSYGLNNAKTQISSLKEAQSVANAQAVERQQQTEFSWQKGLNDALDESNLELKNVELSYNNAIADSVLIKPSGDSDKQMSTTSKPAIVTKSAVSNRCGTASLRTCEIKLLEFAKERDECAVKYNTLLKLYQQLHQDTANAN